MTNAVAAAVPGVASLGVRRSADFLSFPTLLLLVTLYLTDMNDYDAVNAVWDAWVPAGTAPTRACVQVTRLAAPGWKVEVAVQAAL